MQGRWGLARAIGHNLAVLNRLRCAKQLKITTFNLILTNIDPITPITVKGKNSRSASPPHQPPCIKQQNNKKLPRENSIEKNQKAKN
jgi:hypothetical protein